MVSVTKVNNVRPYSHVNRILLLRSSNLSKSPSTPRHLLILPGLFKYPPFNQPMIQRPWLLALQQRLSQYLLERSQFVTVPLPVRRGSLRAPQPTKVQELQPPAISELVSEFTKLDLDPPTSLPNPRDPSRSSSEPPTRTGWFSKSVTSSPAVIQRPLPDQLVSPSPTPSLRVFEAPSNSSSVGGEPATSTVYNTGSRYITSIPLLGRLDAEARMVIVEDLGTSCALSSFILLISI